MTRRYNSKARTSQKATRGGASGKPRVRRSLATPPASALGLRSSSFGGMSPTTPAAISSVNGKSHPNNRSAPATLDAVSRIGIGTFRSALAPLDLSYSGTLVDRAQFSRLAGLSFLTPTGSLRRDASEALGYLPDLTLAHYWARYRRGGIAKRIVEAYPKATWAGETWLEETADASLETEFERAADALIRRLDVWGRFLRADILCGLGEYSVLLIGAPGALNTPLPIVGRPEQIACLTPLMQVNAKIKQLDESPGPRFGLPLSYEIRLSSTRPTQEVHWSRIIHVADDLLENDIFGIPRLEAVWNHLDDLVKIVGGGSEASWNRMDPGMQIDVDPEIEFDADEEDDLDEQLDAYRHGLDRNLRTRGTKINMLAANVAAFGSNATAVLEQISGTSAIPLRILLGTERGQLASTQDRDNWSDRVTERRKMLGNRLVGQLVDRLIGCGALPKPTQYRTIWSEIDELNSQAKAAVAMSLSQANAASFNVERKPLLTVDEIRVTVFNLEPLVWDAPDVDDGDRDDPDLEREIGDGDSDDDNLDSGGDGDLPQRDATRAAFTDVDTAPTEPDWRVVHRVGDEYLVAAERSWRRLWRDAAMRVEDRSYQLDYLLSQRNAQGAESLVMAALSEAEDSNRPRIERHLTLVTGDAGEAAAANASRRGSLFDQHTGPTISPAPGDDSVVGAADKRQDTATTIAFKIIFDAVDTASIAFAKGYAYDLIVNTSRETRAAIRNIIVRGLSEGIAPRRLRDMIVRVIGLRPDQVTALENFISRGASRRQAERYAKKLLRDRALLIARTEVLRAANEGQRILWMQAASSGLLPSDQKRRWITTLDGRERDAHHDMHGQIRGLAEKFTNPESGARIEPGEEPNCRCSATLATPADIRRYEREQAQ